MSRWAARKDRYPALAASLPPWLLARVLVTLAALGAGLLYLQEPGWGHALVGHDRGLMSWDADWYLRIAAGGYRSLPLEGLRYFPLFPLAARDLAGLLGGATKLALLAIANSFAVVLAVLLYKLVMEEKEDPALARRVAWLAALAPPAFVLVMGYTEPLAMTFAVWAFLSMRRGRWWQAAAAGLLAGLVRPTGLLLVVPLLIEARRDIALAIPSKIAARSAAILAPLVGTGLYLAWAGSAYNDPFLPLTVQQRSDARGGFQDPLVTFWHAAQDLFAHARVDQGLHLLWVALFIYLIVLSFRHWPASYGAYAVVGFLQAVSTSNLNSLERYCFGTFPVILAAAYACRSKTSERTLIVGSAALLTAYATAAFISGYVP